MAKLDFKDLIFKYLKQEEPTHNCTKVHPKMSHKEWMNTEPVSMHKEDYVVKYQHYKTSPMMAAAYKDKKAAEKFRDSVLKQGGKAILSTRADYKKGSGIIPRIKEEVKEAFSVQITKTDGGKFIHGTYKSKSEAEKWIKWYKTGDLRKTKKIEIVKEDKDGKAYAIGMAKAKEVMKDEPPLEKKTITKAHDIAKAIKRDETIRIRPKNAIGEKKSPFRLSYSKQGTHAGFEDADTLSDLQNKAQKLRSKGFTIDKMGRNTSPVKEETIVEYTDKQIKQAYGILNDPRYKGGNYSGAVAAIEKLAKGLSKHKDVANALKRANESYVHPGKATFERIYREVSDKLKLKVLDRKIKRAKDKFHKGLRRP